MNPCLWFLQGPLAGVWLQTSLLEHCSLGRGAEGAEEMWFKEEVLLPNGGEVWREGCVQKTT